MINFYLHYTPSGLRDGTFDTIQNDMLQLGKHLSFLISTAFGQYSTHNKRIALCFKAYKKQNAVGLCWILKKNYII